MDGSSAPFVFLLKSAGLRYQSEKDVLFALPNP